MLPGLRPDLPARSPAPSSAAICPSKLALASFGRLPLHLSCPHVPRQLTFLPSPTSSSHPSAPRCILRYCCRPCLFPPVLPDLAPPVVAFRRKGIITARRRKEESRKKTVTEDVTAVPACLPPRPVPSRPVWRCHRHSRWYVMSCPPVVILH